MQDTNSLIRSMLITQPALVALVGTRIYSPRLPSGKPPADPIILPALTFFTHGGTSSPYIPGLVEPSVQFDCWANDPIVARQVYRALYDALQGYESNGYIKACQEEVQGMDLEDDMPGYFRCLSFFKFIIDA